MLFQVSFVFTNQIDGKLIPIESTKGSNAQGSEGPKDHLQEKATRLPKPVLPSLRDVKTHSPTPAPALPSPEDSTRCTSATICYSSEKSTTPTLCKSIEKGTTKLARSSIKGLRAPRKPRISHENQLPLKRLSSTVDDDFM